MCAGLQSDLFVSVCAAAADECHQEWAWSGLTEISSNVLLLLMRMRMRMMMRGLFKVEGICFLVIILWKAQSVLACFFFVLFYPKQLGIVQTKLT